MAACLFEAALLADKLMQANRLQAYVNGIAPALPLIDRQHPTSPGHPRSIRVANLLADSRLHEIDPREIPS
jgi:hypothetical protein